DRRSELRQRRHGAREILPLDSRPRGLLGFADRLVQRDFLRLRSGDSFTGERLAGLLLLFAQDIRRSPVSGEEVLAVLAVQELAERRHPADDKEKVILIAEREHGVDQIVPGALL